MLRRAWKPLTAATVLIGAPGYFYYSSRRKEETFELPVRTRNSEGKLEMTNRTFSLRSMQSVDALLTANATSDRKPRPDGVVWMHTTAALASNDPIEDANSNAIIRRDDNDPAAPGDLLFFTVMDGHGGYHTSQLLSKVLINAVVLELSRLSNPGFSQTKQGTLDRLRSFLWESPRLAGPPDADPGRVASAIQTAFIDLDKELLNAPLRILASNLNDEARKNKLIPDLSSHPLALTSMLPAISGSCALMAVLDTAHRNLYVACTGDSRAVAGIWDESEDGTGSWRVEVLSEDQTGRNIKELKRIQSEHPADEASDVIRAGRVLGGLEPSRAFGDARYKWPLEIQSVLNQAFLAGNNQPMRAPPPSFKTPPYVTSRPEVTHRKFDFLPLADASSRKQKSTLRFIVLATDGLWDELSSEEVVSLVAGHLSGVRGTIPKSSLSALVPVSMGTPTVEGKDKAPANREEGSWAFKDDNLSTHLIRNAFGGGNEQKLRRLLSIPAPLSRRHRDDTTVTVVWWEDGRGDVKTVELSKAKL